MAEHDPHLTRMEEHKIEGSNIELFGSEIETRVREHAGDKEPAWENAGQEPGTQIWRIEQFKVVPWPDKHKGTFYSGDSYIVLHTYKKDPDSEKLSYDLHFWLGENTTQDEAGTAAYKTVELDDHLHGDPVEYRETNTRILLDFLSYFPSFTCLKGGVASGFHHVTDPPPPDVFKLYHIVAPTGGAPSHVIVREVSPQAPLSYGDVYVLDRGTDILQFNMQGSSGKERFKAGDFARKLSNSRAGTNCPVVVSEQGAPGAGTFLAALGIPPDRLPRAPPPAPPKAQLFRINDQEGFSAAESLDSSDAFILHAYNPPAIFVWIGTNASRAERKTALRYGQRFLQVQPAEKGTALIRLSEGRETAAFLAALKA
ncbi:actin depolymerizing protein [Auricularia subglabra TFB-10046 SS5]|nr:actin depolymerizing protein [Auricularia subglabra TFB-10046 SS5]